MSQNFGHQDLLVTLDQPKKDWDSKNRPKNTHLGQLKLLLGELAFLLDFVDDLANVTLVYAGAAPGQHIKAVAYLFPDLEMHLYDPAPFAIQETENIHIYQSYFTDEIAEKWANVEKVLFVSDIRSGGDTRDEFEEEVHRNMMMQEKWVRIIKPERFSLKFRIPYTVIERGEKYKYLGGTLIYQAYPKADSMEMRLIGDEENATNPNVVYDSINLEKILFYHNSTIRPLRTFYTNVTTRDNTEYPSTSGLYRDYDSSYFLFTVIRYLEKSSPSMMEMKEKNVLALADKLLFLTYGSKFDLHFRRNN